jgi:hypothetical protein
LAPLLGLLIEASTQISDRFLKLFPFPLALLMQQFKLCL